MPRRDFNQVFSARIPRVGPNVTDRPAKSDMMKLSLGSGSKAKLPEKPLCITKLPPGDGKVMVRGWGENVGSGSRPLGEIGPRHQGTQDSGAHRAVAIQRARFSA